MNILPAVEDASLNIWPRLGGVGRGLRLLSLDKEGLVDLFGRLGEGEVVLISGIDPPEAFSGDPGAVKNSTSFSSSLEADDRGLGCPEASCFAEVDSPAGGSSKVESSAAKSGCGSSLEGDCHRRGVGESGGLGMLQGESRHAP